MLIAVGQRHRRSRASRACSSRGAIEGIKIDVGKLLDGEFPIVDIDAIGVSVKGNMFGGELNATLIGGILKLDAGGRIIDPFDTITPVADRVLFVGVEGGFSFAGIGGLDDPPRRCPSSGR